MAKTRKKIPKETTFEVLMEAGYRCGNPACGHILTLEIHHIIWVKDDGGNEPSNLLALCPNCHSLHTQGHIPQEAIRHWKGMLLALNHAFDRQSMDLLLYLHIPQGISIVYSGDGVLHFAGLIAKGLVGVGNSTYSGMIGPGYVPQSSHQLYLTQSGKQLVEAWLSGDEQAYRKWVSQPENP